MKCLRDREEKDALDAIVVTEFLVNHHYVQLVGDRIYLCQHQAKYLFCKDDAEIVVKTGLQLREESNQDNKT